MSKGPSIYRRLGIDVVTALPAQGPGWNLKLLRHDGSWSRPFEQLSHWSNRDEAEDAGREYLAQANRPTVMLLCTGRVVAQ
ncbi:hypothetical protein [uncultured Parasphingopyxis sp.]|uniref:hypothetical protein n=1 Tax=uncultured Parasphingopyxis sp. TaxID=1547918 RepID=UPI00261AF1BF|nr:hypothetical protein [uncultured Parasphingopyxis sp.]